MNWRITLYECKRFGAFDGTGYPFSTHWQARWFGRRAYWSREQDFVTRYEIFVAPSLGKYLRVWCALFLRAFVLVALGPRMKNP